MQMMETTSISSPPRPKRHVMPYISNPPSPSGAAVCPDITMPPVTSGMTDDVPLQQFESRRVEQAVADLPGVFTEVFSMQRDQSNEINKQRQLIEFLKGKVKEVEEKKEELVLETTCVQNKIYMKQEWIKDANKRIKLLDTDIQRLVVLEVDRQSAVSRAEEEIEIQRKQFQRQFDKMDVYKQTVTQYEDSKSTVYKELQDLKAKVQLLRKQQAELDCKASRTQKVLSGELEKEVHKEIDALKMKLLQAGKEDKVRQQKISEEKTKQDQIRQTIKVLGKRNAAQMIRLERQVMEVETRNRKKEQQIRQLQDHITQASHNWDN